VFIRSSLALCVIRLNIMWNPFKTKPLLSANDREFQLDCFEWLLKYFGGPTFYDGANLILPTDNYFPNQVTSNQDAAYATFQQVLEHAGLSDWPVTLEAQQEDVSSVVSPTVVIQNADASPAGTFKIDENNKVTITYNPGIVSDPMKMVAVFSHELAHYLTATAPEPPPGGWDNWEFTTDTCAIFMGFGIFQANSAFNFHQYASVDSFGWRTSGVGYLSPQERCFALALFLKLKNISPSAAFPYCDKNVKTYLKHAITELESSDIVEGLKKVRYDSQIA